MQHEFEIENYDPDRIYPALDGFGLQPYSKTQYKLDEVVKEYLKKKGYIEISYPDLDEVVLGKENNKISIMDGEKYSVGALIFVGTFDM
ncbi:hypothetical protein [Clostridium sp.]|uniref:hypothetical protein n=1 Tax=Clostridium sp. TaxID=1506 RepID=UPI002FCA00A6